MFTCVNVMEVDGALLEGYFSLFAGKHLVERNNKENTRTMAYLLWSSRKNVLRDIHYPANVRLEGLRTNEICA